MQRTYNSSKTVFNNFLKKRKAWWLAPTIIMLILVGTLIIFSQSSAVSPFIYALF